MPAARRFPPPWSVEEMDACFVVTDSAGQDMCEARSQKREARSEKPEARSQKPEARGSGLTDQ